MTSVFLLSTTSGKILISNRGAKILKWEVLNKRKESISIIEAEDRIDRWFESAVLFPWVNRLENGTSVLKNRSIKLSDFDEGLHGLVFDADFECSFQSENKIVLRLVPNQLNFFPFSFDFQVTYELLNDGLSVYFKVENKDVVVMPFAAGWHPYFLLPDDSIISIKNVEKFSLDEQLLPTGKSDLIAALTYNMQNEPDDLLFIKTGKVNVKSTQFELEISTQKMPFFQFFQDKRHRGFAIEALSGAGNCLNNKIGLLEIEPNSVWEGRVEVNFKLKV